jgi:hypothetical protein
VTASVHLLKLFVGLATLPQLIAFQRNKLKVAKAAGEPLELVHITRHTPKRAGELLSGGSIYWIMSGAIVGCQRLLALRPIVVDHVPHCQIVFDPKLIAVAPRDHRPFQGWRYLDPKDAPADLKKGSRPRGLSAEIALELSRLGLL